MTTTFCYVDAKDRTSGNTSDFICNIAGGETLTLYENTKVRVDNLRICNAFWTVGPLNQFLYVNDKSGEHIFKLSQGYFSAYDLANMLAQVFGAAYNISWKDATNSLIINRFDGDSMHIWTDAEMASQKGNYNPQSFNAMLKNPDGAQINASSFTTLFVTTCPYDHIFLRSSRLSGTSRTQPRAKMTFCCEFRLTVDIRT